MVKADSLRLVALAALLTVTSCAKPWPMPRGAMMTVAPARAIHGSPTQPIPRPADSLDAKPLLRIGWLGTSCHTIEFGEAGVLTDPFFSYYRTGRVLFGRIAPDPDVVRARTQELRKPDAIFIGHAHYDHVLDVEELVRQRGWYGVPLIGSMTARSLVCSFDRRLEEQWQLPVLDNQWHRVGENVEYLALPAQHAPQLLGRLWFDGTVDGPLPRPPRRARQFKGGQAYLFVFRLHSGGKTRTVLFADSATPVPAGLAELFLQPIDAAILCVPGWQNAKGYPGDLIRALRPRVVVASHFDDFFEPDRAKRGLVATTDLRGFIRAVFEAVDNADFEGVIVPDVDSVVGIDAAAGPR